MSYDILIYFKHKDFPYQDWENILSTFKAEKRVNGETTKDMLEWFVSNDSTVWISVNKVEPAQPGGCCSNGANWAAMISTSAGRSPQSVWVQFAIPYYALELMPDSIVHDCQFHEMGCFENSQEYLKFANKAILKLAQKRRLLKLGLMTEEGEVVF